ncbi:MAG: erythromycin esterase family protein [Tumebacillaceae bacterium]
MNPQPIIEEIRRTSIRFDTNDDLDVLVDAIGDARFVLLGEASHGTAEFYSVRADLSKRLIEKKGFSFLAVEGDWPSCYTLNRYIKQYPDAPSNAREAMRDFNRWPTWMWANTEILSLMDWLRAHNANRSNQEKVGFYGLDVYSLRESMEEVIRHLEQTGSPEVEQARRAFECFEPYGRSEQTYGMSAAFLSESCEEEVVKLLLDLQAKRRREHPESEAALSAELNALVAVDAERYYRTMVRGGPDSWNVRDHHMVECLNQLMQFHGPDTKAIIWEHNTHIGDARATDMAAEGMVNVGSLLREQEEEDRNRVYAIGFGTHRGTVIAGNAWGAPMEKMIVPPGVRNSWEDLMHRAGNHNQILLLGPDNPYFQMTLGHRAIGVVYHPEYEHRGNYVPSVMSERYDAFLYIEETNALEPLAVEHVVV